MRPVCVVVLAIKLHNGVLYWLVDGAIVSTRDKGEIWKKLDKLIGAG